MRQGSADWTIAAFNGITDRVAKLDIKGSFRRAVKSNDCVDRRRSCRCSPHQPSEFLFKSSPPFGPSRRYREIRSPDGLLKLVAVRGEYSQPYLLIPNIDIEKGAWRGSLLLACNELEERFTGRVVRLRGLRRQRVQHSEKPLGFRAAGARSDRSWRAI